MLINVFGIGIGDQKTLRTTDLAKNSLNTSDSYPNSEGTKGKAFFKRQHSQTEMSPHNSWVWSPAKAYFTRNMFFEDIRNFFSKICSPKKSIIRARGKVINCSCKSLFMV